MNPNYLSRVHFPLALIEYDTMLSIFYIKKCEMESLPKKMSELLIPDEVSYNLAEMDDRHFYNTLATMPPRHALNGAPWHFDLFSVSW